MALAVMWLQVALMVAGPLAVAGMLLRRWRLSWRLFGWGAAGFVGSQIVHLPLLAALPLPPAAEAPWIVSLALGLCAAVCEEPARWLVLRFALRDARSFREGVVAGVGHGGIESLLLGLVVAGSALGALAVPETAPALALTSARGVLEAAPHLRLLAATERACAMTFHVSASVLALRAVREGRFVWVLAAIALHTAMNALVLRALLAWGAVAAEVALLAITTVPVAILIWSSRTLGDARDEGRARPSDTAQRAAADGAIVCEALGKSFDGRPAVEELDLTIGRGQCFALLGPNGAGKTTTVRMLCGLIAPTSGRATVAGSVIGRDDDVLHASIGISTEVPGLYERLTPVENLEFFGRLHGVEPARRRRRAFDLLQTFHLWERRDEPVSAFSKGMKQKLAVARALLHEPEVLFLDEPTSGLDPEAAWELRQMILRLKGEGRTIFLTTHRLDEAEELADRVGIFKTRLVASGTVAELRRRSGALRVTVRLAALDERFESAARATAGVVAVESKTDELAVEVEDLDRDVPRLVRALVEAGADVRAVTPDEGSLEQAYLALVGSTDGNPP